VRWIEEGRHRSRSFRTGKEARAFEPENRRRLRMGAFAPRGPSALTLDEWLDRWVSVSSIAWEWNTSRGRTSLIDTHVRPFLGRARLRDMGRARIQTWRRELIASGRSNHTVNQATKELSAALGKAVEEGVALCQPRAEGASVGCRCEVC
jgi:integrase-like protein